MKHQIINNSISTESFSESYPFINKYMVENADMEESRNGDTKEILNFKTEITNPYKRCVGNNERNINVFFLLAEAMWIFVGRKDVEFLEIFNSNIRDYSDDGITFHAPYGFRLRHWGVPSSDHFKPTGEQQAHAFNQYAEGRDQMLENLEILASDSQCRRVVLSIWNPDLDLNTKTKDTPCNDLLMIKVRKGKMHSTISNRSNDLHWGLPTNVFQFSFVTEVMSNILQIELGTQVHNSQSLHFYLGNDIAMKMYENMQFSNLKFTDLYEIASPSKIDMNFSYGSINLRLREVDSYMGQIIDYLTKDERAPEKFLQKLREFSKFLYLTYELLYLYMLYKKETKTDEIRLKYFHRASYLADEEFHDADIVVLAMNFFAARIDSDILDSGELIGKF